MSKGTFVTLLWKGGSTLTFQSSTTRLGNARTKPAQAAPAWLGGDLRTLLPMSSTGRLELNEHKAFGWFLPQLPPDVAQRIGQASFIAHK